MLVMVPYGGGGCCFKTQDLTKSVEKKKTKHAAENGSRTSDRYKNCWWSLQDAPQDIRGNKAILMEAVQKDWRALKYATPDLKGDKELVLTAVKHQGGSGKAILFASDKLKADKEIVLACVHQDGNCLRFACDHLRADKECIIAAVSNRPEALKFALQGLHQDRECLVAAGLWDQDYKHHHNSTNYTGVVTNSSSNKGIRRVVLSTRFSLQEDSTPTATQFTVLLKSHPSFQPSDFSVYSPNAFNKGTCDEEWTRMEWPCRGTPETCRMILLQDDDDKKGNGVVGPPCWRYSFRCHLQEAHQTGGFMIQIVELVQRGGNTSYDYCHQLGKGQQIERVMAQQVGVKVFVVYQSMNLQYRHRLQFEEKDIDRLSEVVQEWYAGNCSDREVCHVGGPIIQNPATLGGSSAR